MYVCGPTVYQRAHIGNAVPFVIFAWLRNWLRERGYDVTYVHNITDVNDKIYEAAPGASAARAREATAWYLEDTRCVRARDAGRAAARDRDDPRDRRADRGARRQPGTPTRPAATSTSASASFAGYGALSGQRLDQVEDEEPSPLKEDPRDFALWKATKEGEDTSWDSPWGAGRPGWHIECSAMAEKTLGPEFLIHGGGLDLVFPHHENERAQSQAVGRPFAKIWMHNGLLRFTGEKMSKSVGNVATIQEVIAEWGQEAALLFLMTGHWRKPLEFSQEAMTAASRAGREPAQRAARRDARRRATGTSWARCSTTTSTRRQRSPSSTAGRARARSTSCAAVSPSSGSAALGGRRRGTRRGGRARAGADCGARGPRLRRVGSPARRDRRGRLGGA